MMLPDQSLHLFQVCLSLKDDGTRHRELDALQRAMKELNIEKGTIITLDEEEEIAVPSGKIHCLPAWKFMI